MVQLLSAAPEILGRRELTTVWLLRPAAPLFLPSLLEQGRQRESVQGSVARFKESGPRAQQCETHARPCESSWSL